MSMSPRLVNTFSRNKLHIPKREEKGTHDKVHDTHGPRHSELNDGMDHCVVANENEHGPNDDSRNEELHWEKVMSCCLLKLRLQNLYASKVQD